jgi:hypothetical protein
VRRPGALLPDEDGAPLTRGCFSRAQSARARRLRCAFYRAALCASFKTLGRVSRRRALRPHAHPAAARRLPAAPAEAPPHGRPHGHGRPGAGRGRRGAFP